MTEQSDRLDRMAAVMQRLEQVCRQADELFKMAEELRAEASMSIQLVKELAEDRKVKRKRAKRKGR